MDCAACASLIEMDFEDVGIKAKCSYPNETLEVEFNERTHNESVIKEVVSKSGFAIST